MSFSLNLVPSIRLSVARIPRVLFVVVFLLANNGQSQTQEIEGRWKVVERYPKVRSLSSYFVFKDGKLKGGLLPSNYSVDSTKTPKEIDFTLQDTSKGIYKLEGNKLTICKASPNEPRPHSFDLDRNRDKGWRVTVYEKATEKVDPHVALLVGEWEPTKTANVPYRFIETMTFTQSGDFENRVSAVMSGWPQRKLGDPKKLASFRVELDSSKMPPELSGVVYNALDPQKNLRFVFSGTYELNNDQLKLRLNFEEKSGIRRVSNRKLVPFRMAPFQWYFELKKR